MTSKNIYQYLSVPKNLSFDEESLFWRLRYGEGLPSREWHKPLDREKTWHEIKLDLDKKLETVQNYSVCQKVYSKRNSLLFWFTKIIQNLKMAFLLVD
jgi:hypothetical protein